MYPNKRLQKLKSHPTYMADSSLMFFEGPMPAFGSVIVGYAPRPAIIQTHSDRTKPM